MKIIDIDENRGVTVTEVDVDENGEITVSDFPKKTIYQQIREAICSVCDDSMNGGCAKCSNRDSLVEEEDSRRTTIKIEVR